MLRRLQDPESTQNGNPSSQVSALTFVASSYSSRLSDALVNLLRPSGRLENMLEDSCAMKTFLAALDAEYHRRLTLGHHPKAIIDSLFAVLVPALNSGAEELQTSNHAQLYEKAKAAGLSPFNAERAAHLKAELDRLDETGVSPLEGWPSAASGWESPGPPETLDKLKKLEKPQSPSCFSKVDKALGVLTTRVHKASAFKDTDSDRNPDSDTGIAVGKLESASEYQSRKRMFDILNEPSAESEVEYQRSCFDDLQRGYKRVYERVTSSTILPVPEPIAKMFHIGLDTP